jgi:predicted PurR-regulated permease PerM
MSDTEKKNVQSKAIVTDGPRFEDRVLVAFVIAASLAMAWISWPFFGAILWALVVAIAFAPVHTRIALMMPKWRNSAALLALVLVIALVILPTIAIGSMMVDEAITTYNSLQSREIDLGRIIGEIEAAIPKEWRQQLKRYDFNLQEFQGRLSTILTSGLQLIAREAVSIGQGALNFALTLGVMLYLTFFLLRDGRHLSRRIGEVIPLRTEQRSALFEKFTTVIRATVKGSVIVAIVQGTLGGILFAVLDIRAALLWGVVMGLLALIPAVGTGLVWFPVGIYLLVTGSITEGIILLLCGVFIISMVDNLLRPILVGQDTRMPDYVVLISTLGGLSVMGINGLIVGPVIAAMFIAAWEIFGQSRAALRH